MFGLAGSPVQAIDPVHLHKVEPSAEFLRHQTVSIHPNAGINELIGIREGFMVMLIVEQVVESVTHLVPHREFSHRFFHPHSLFRVAGFVEQPEVIFPPGSIRRVRNDQRGIQPCAGMGTLSTMEPVDPVQHILQFPDIQKLFQFRQWVGRHGIKELQRRNAVGSGMVNVVGSLLKQAGFRILKAPEGIDPGLPFRRIPREFIDGIEDIGCIRTAVGIGLLLIQVPRIFASPQLMGLQDAANLLQNRINVVLFHRKPLR